MKQKTKGRYPTTRTQDKAVKNTTAHSLMIFALKYMQRDIRMAAVLFRRLTLEQLWQQSRQ